MKRRVTVICLLAGFMLCSCKEQEITAFPFHESATTSPAIEMPSPMPPTSTPTSQPSEMPAPIISEEPASTFTYDEYFSQVRRLERTSVENYASYKSYPEREVFYPKEFEDMPESQLWSVTPVNLYRIRDGKVLSENAYSYDECSNCVLWIEGGTDLLMLENSSDDPMLVFHDDDANVSQLFCYEYTCFFACGTKLYRLFLPDRTVDFLCDTGWNPDDEPYAPWKGGSRYASFEAISNCDIRFFVRNSLWLLQEAEAAGMTVDEYFGSMTGPYSDVHYNSNLDKYFTDDLTADLLDIPEEKRITYKEYLAYLEQFNFSDEDFMYG